MALLFVFESPLRKIGDSSFGWLHPKATKRLSKVRTLLAVPILLTHPTPPEPPLQLRCPHCGKHALEIIGRLPRCRPP
jgi:hypothetical protein